MEEALRRADMPPWHVIYRLVIGFCLVPFFRVVTGAHGSDWWLFPYFLFVLLTLRLVPAVVRSVVPFSEDVRAHWSRHRILAKHFDSYQWRKLLWFGLGLAAYVTLVGRGGGAAIALVVACLLAGGFGAWRWRRIVRSDRVVAVLSRTGRRSGPAA